VAAKCKHRELLSSLVKFVKGLLRVLLIKRDLNSLLTKGGPEEPQSDH
jgi:hypothetical protein